MIETFEKDKREVEWKWNTKTYVYHQTSKIPKSLNCRYRDKTIMDKIDVLPVVSHGQLFNNLELCRQDKKAILNCDSKKKSWKAGLWFETSHLSRPSTIPFKCHFQIAEEKYLWCISTSAIAQNYFKIIVDVK